MKPSDLKRLYSNVKPSTDLDQQVLSDIDGLRASMPSHVTPHRALVPAIACAVCLLVAALYLSTGAAPDGNDAAIHSAVSNAFNLEVAEANDSTGSTEIAASPSGLMPVNEGVDAAHLELMLNLDVRGGKRLLRHLPHGGIANPHHQDHRRAPRRRGAHPELRHCKDRCVRLSGRRWPVEFRR